LPRNQSPDLFWRSIRVSLKARRENSAGLFDLMNTSFNNRTGNQEIKDLRGVRLKPTPKYGRGLVVPWG
jgi:hypothetical protein